MMDENEKQPDFSENEKELIDEDYTADIDLSGYFLEKARIQEEEKKAEETRKKEKEEKPEEKKDFASMVDGLSDDELASLKAAISAHDEKKDA